jgi:hypothetical protein
MFQLTKEEFEIIRFQFETIDERDHPLRFQNETSNKTKDPMKFQIETSKGRGGTRYLPYAFTEQGVAMLSGILSSDKAVSMNIAIMRAFVEVRKVFLHKTGIKEQLKEIKDRLGEHDVQLNQIYDAMENLLDDKAAAKNWNNRERIGFKKDK